MNQTYSKPWVAASVSKAVNRSLSQARHDADHDLPIVTCEEMLMVCELYTAVTSVETEI